MPQNYIFKDDDGSVDPCDGEACVIVMLTIAFRKKSVVTISCLKYLLVMMACYVMKRKGKYP